MFKNKNVVAVVAVVLLVALAGTCVAMILGNRNNESKNGLPTVTENDITPVPTKAPTSTPEIDYSDVGLPVSENEGKDNLITEEQAAADTTPDPELDAYEAAREEKGVTPEVSKEEIVEYNNAIEKAKEEVKENPEVEIQEPIGEPVEFIEPQPTPQKDENGYIYTKEKAIEIFRTEYQKLIDSNDFNYTYARETAISSGVSTQEEFDADIKQLFTDPYSSERLTIAFEDFRKYGQWDALVLKVYIWLSSGGDDGEYSETMTQ